MRLEKWRIMRLGQIARKYDVTVQDIIDILKENDPDLDSMHPNAKLDLESEAFIEERFRDSSQDFPVTDTEAETADISIKSIEASQTDDKLFDEMNIDIFNELHEDINSSEDTSSETEEIIASNPEIITTDKLLELVESDEQNVDLSKITLIKAPKKELDGLKVLGKIDLPEPRKPKSHEKEDKKSKESEKRQNHISEEEAEKRRLWAKKKKEENEARLEQKRKEKEKQQLKALREAHYKQRVQQIKPKSKKKKSQTVNSDIIEALAEKKPKTILGKFWRWLNT